MLILAADTSTNAGSLALVDATAESLRVLVERSWDLAGGAQGNRRPKAPNHSDRIVPEIEEMLVDSGISYADLGGVACAAGPGSFTGLRVALSALKGIAFARDLPLAGVSTLEALAWNAPFSARRVVAMLDARKSEVYAAVFDATSGMPVRVREDAVLPPGPFLESLRDDGEPVVFVGDGAPAYRALVTGILGDRAAILDGSANLPRAGNVARIAAPMLAAGRTAATEPAALAPRYLRRPEAEWKKLGTPSA